MLYALVDVAEKVDVGHCVGQLGLARRPGSRRFTARSLPRRQRRRHVDSVLDEVSHKVGFVERLGRRVGGGQRRACNSTMRDSNERVKVRQRERLPIEQVDAVY